MVNEKEHGKIVIGPWVKDAHSPTSLGTFHNQTHHYLLDLLAAQDSLLGAYKLLWKSTNIWPDQCDRTILLLRTIGRPVQGFYQLLKTPALLPDAVIPFRYPLAIALDNMNEQVVELMTLVNSFRTECKVLSPQLTTKRQDILSKFESLIHSCEDTSQKTHTFLESIIISDYNVPRTLSKE